MQKGYVWPKDEEIPLIMKNFYKPKGYQVMREGKEQLCQTLAGMKHFVGEWLLSNKKKGSMGCYGTWNPKKT